MYHKFILSIRIYQTTFMFFIMDAFMKCYCVFVMNMFEF